MHHGSDEFSYTCYQNYLQPRNQWSKGIWEAEGKYSNAKSATDLNTQGGLCPIFASYIETDATADNIRQDEDTSAHWLGFSSKTEGTRCV